MACLRCGSSTKPVGEALGACRSCILEGSAELEEQLASLHGKSL